MTREQLFPLKKGDLLGRVKMKDARFERIKEKIESGLSVAEISRIEKCTERTVRQIRDGEMVKPSLKDNRCSEPAWSHGIDWESIYKGVVVDGHYLSHFYEESGTEISYAQFRRYFNKRYPLLKLKTSTPRFFAPGERIELDFSGKKLEWIDPRTGEIFEREVFVSALGHSQKVFAVTSPSQKSEDFIDCHNKMFEFYGGAPKILVPDNLKSGVNQSDLYDPDLNKTYEDMARHFGSVVVPARAYKPKDKSLAELTVKLVMKAFAFKYRRQTFTSPKELDEALLSICEQINSKVHTRFKVSREQRFEESEKAALKPLPKYLYEFATFKESKVHPDSHIQVDYNYYSVPHRLRGQSVRVRLTPSKVEVFEHLEKVAHHQRVGHKKGTYVTLIDHLPERSKAYLETTPQNILSQARFINRDLATLIDELFNNHGPLENLRRAQGIVRAAQSEFKLIGRDQAKINIEEAIRQMRGFERVRTNYFRDLLKKYRGKALKKTSTDIKRKPGNPNLRHTKDQPINKGESHGNSTSEKHDAGTQAAWNV